MPRVRRPWELRRAGWVLLLALLPGAVACDREGQDVPEGVQQGAREDAAPGTPPAREAPQRDPAERGAPPVALNPVQHEMRLLHEVMLEAVTAIANGNVTSVAKSLHVLHGAKEQTEAAIRAGTYTPPKNGEAIARFIELDEEFHGHLEVIVARSKENDVVGTATALGKALEGCQGCHAEFRF